MRPSPRIIMRGLDGPVSIVWIGPLLELCRANGWTDGELRELCAALRSGEDWITGGGAAPAFRVSLYDA